MLNSEKLKKIRKTKKVTQGQLAKQLGKSKIIIHLWESGKRNPGDSDIRMIAVILGISVSEISDLKDLGISEYNDTSISKELEKLDKIIKEIGDYPDLNIGLLSEINEKYTFYRNENIRLKKRLNGLNNTIDELSQIVFIKDRNYKYRVLNNAFMHMAGLQYKKEDIIGYKASDIFGLKEIQHILKYEQDVFKNRERLTNKQVIIPGSKGAKVGLLSITPILNDKNEVNEILCTINDITVLSEAIEKQNFFKKIINEMEDVVWIKSFNPVKYEFLSDSCEKIIGISKKDLTSNPNLIQKVIEPEVLKTKCSYSNGRIYFKPGVHKAKYIKPDGSSQLVESRIYATTNKKGEKILYGINRCLSEDG
ncbi:MAG: helix-turn-helix domain-containing protein [bacterium]|nr:helix-turn-helix domain-containing protein [bacterium]